MVLPNFITNYGENELKKQSKIMVRLPTWTSIRSVWSTGLCVKLGQEFDKPAVHSMRLDTGDVLSTE